MENVIILGSGPAGLTAGIYLGRAGLNPIIIAGREIGGQLSWTTEVENFPGFPDGIMAADLIDRMKKQAEKWGAKIENDVAIEVDFSKKPLTVKTTKNIFEAKAVIVSMGATHKKLGAIGEDHFIGRGVSYCATCDGPFFKDKEVIVVGGGDCALSEALFLKKFAKKITLVHRRDVFKGSVVLQERVLKEKDISIAWNTEVSEIGGNNTVEWVKLKDLLSGKESQISTQGVFVFVGQGPTTKIFEEKLDMDERGYLKVDWKKHTSVEGVFAAGQSEDWYFMQAITAAGDGCKAALEVERWLAVQE